MTPSSWYLMNGKRLISGLIPKYRFDILNKLDVNATTNQPLIKYYCVISYLRLFDNYPKS